MKTIKFITALVILTGLTSLSVAGPGPDLWMRMNQAAKDKAAIETKAKVESAAKVAQCATCSCPAMKKS
jgi:hypothetical protein